MQKKFLLKKPALYLIAGIIVTLPIVFGAVHPAVLGCYVFLMLVGLGGWLLLNGPSENVESCSTGWLVVPIVLIVFLVFQSLPLPIDWVEILSPARAERVRMVNLLAGTSQQFITLSERGSFGIYRAIFLLALICYYFSLKRLFGNYPISYTTVIFCLIAVGVFEASYGLVQFINPHVGVLWLPIKGRAAHGTIIYKNQFASLLNMIWPLAVAVSTLYFVKNKKNEGRKHISKKAPETLGDITITKTHVLFLVFAACLMVLSVLFSLSRGGMLAMVLVALGLVAMLPFAKRKKVIFFALFLCLVGGYGAMLGLDTITSRFDSIGRSGTNRIDIYLSSLPMLMDHWLTGIGIGSYTLLSPVYLKGFPVNIHYDRVHNEYLELMIELGIPMATLLFCWMLFGVIKIVTALMSKELRTAGNLNRAILGSAAFCGLVGFLVHGAVDFGWRLPVNLVYSITLLALIAGSLSASKAELSR